MNGWEERERGNERGKVANYVERERERDIGLSKINHNNKKLVELS